VGKTLRIDCGDMPARSVRNGCGRFDNATEQLRPEGYDEQLETEVKAKSLTVFARIDHAAGAAQVGQPLPPTALLIFGNAKGGTPLMQSVQTIGIDLPLKALVWQDVSGATWLSYNDPAWLAKRHGAGHDVDGTVTALTGALHALAKTATGAQ
jgi:uncharacterized protein (DUF302 family)